jgi:hypothetical protein
MGIKITGTEIVNTSTTGDIVIKDSVGSEHFRFTKDGKFYKGGKNTDEFENIKSLSTQTLSWNGTDGVLTLSGGNSVDLDGRYATPADVTAAINGLVDGAPTALNTLNELAAAIGDNSSYASTITTALGNKADVSHNHDSSYYNVNQDITITKNAPKLVLDSSSGGSDTVEQSATISLGESGTGSASLHLSYIGSGYSYIGMGNLGSDNIADYYAMRLYYTNNNVFFAATNNYITDINAGANAGNAAYGWGDHRSAGYAAGSHNHDGVYAPASHSHSYLPLSGGTLTGDLKTTNVQISSATPTIYFNGTSDGGDGASSDMAIKATPEGLDFYEPEDGNKIHFQILDDTGVNAPYGYKVGAGYVVNSSGAWVGANLAENQINWVYPSAPTLASKATNGDGIQITFNQSNGQYYEIWSSVGNATDYSLVGKVDPNSVAAQMTFIDSTMNTNSATIYYRIYAINKGVYGPPLEFNHAFSWSSPDIAVSSNVLMDLVIVTWEKPQSRLIKGFIVKLHSSSGTPSYASATQVANTTNTMFVYNVPRPEFDYNHEFWIEPVY